MDIADQNPNYIFKYIIIGNASVGKTNLSFRFIKGNFSEKYHPTIGMEFAVKNIKIGDKICRIQLWDTAGQECFKSVSRGYYKNSACALIVYDISNRKSFDNIQTWVEECKNNAPQTLTMVLVGNKSDLEDIRTISYEEGKNLATSNNMLFFETSALNGNNIEKLFYDSAETIVKKMQDNVYDLNIEDCGITIKRENNKKDIQKKKCC